MQIQSDFNLKLMACLLLNEIVVITAFRVSTGKFAGDRGLIQLPVILERRLQDVGYIQGNRADGSQQQDQRALQLVGW
jgi:hypothetical protein